MVTGGAGFIGSALCRRLFTETEDTITVVDKMTYAASRASLAPLEGSPRFRLIEADICDAGLMRDLFEAIEPDHVYHLAAESHVDRSIAGPRAFIDTNVVGTFSLLEAALERWQRRPDRTKDQFRFLHVSTDEVYGALGVAGRFTEDTAYNPSSPYSASKAASNHLAKAWHRTYGLPVLISNSTNNYGPYQFCEKLVPQMIVKAIEGKTLPVYGNGDHVRDWLFVGDHVRALELMMNSGHPGQTYNVGARAERTNLQVVEAICTLLDELLPRKSPHRTHVQFVADRPGHDRRYAVDPSKLERELGWHALESFDSGLRRTVLWYLNNRAWWEPLRSQVYAGERLGMSTVR
ncbi:MAG: dTDP-glucose 4,6-dehydratase [Blastomonas fulva]|uniref:dTDP-glucose 4,6-dehydratase n=1 Tax=Alphaproteobacteria TaxID=28211 RepID=UPI0040343CA5